MAPGQSTIRRGALLSARACEVLSRFSQTFRTPFRTGTRGSGSRPAETRGCEAASVCYYADMAPRKILEQIERLQALASVLHRAADLGADAGDMMAAELKVLRKITLRKIRKLVRRMPNEGNTTERQEGPLATSADSKKRKKKEVAAP